MTHDLIVIGAGPAGMAAAITAAGLGLKTAIVDEQARAGGQIYRNVGATLPEVARLLGPDYSHGNVLAQALNAANVDAYFATSVWDIAPDLTVSAVKDGRSFQLRAPQLVAATGAMERASPIPGWTLPGVLNAGAAQIALKSSGSVPAGKIVLAGGGPLLLLVACQLLDAGADVGAIVETSPATNRSAALRHLATALGAPRLLAKGLAMLLRLRRSGVPWFAQAEGLHVEGKDRANGLSFRTGDRHHRLDADVVLLHHGVVPNTQISRLLRVDHDWDAAQSAWRPRLGAFGETSLPGFRIAGDGGGIAGALAAEASGALATLGAAHALGRIAGDERDRLALAPIRALRAQLRIRPFLDALYRPPEWITAPSGDTVVCRCEEVTAREIAAMVKLGCQGPNQTKFFSRCGMGPCQGRVCGLAVTGILARERNEPHQAIGAYRIRAPLKPIPLSAIANLENRQDASKA
jgi:NADPH-dependent 2,4-dienoyl-CoA reductase/sulfur reductase-like enzyme